MRKKKKKGNQKQASNLAEFVEHVGRPSGKSIYSAKHFIAELFLGIFMLGKVVVKHSKKCWHLQNNNNNKKINKAV